MNKKITMSLALLLFCAFSNSCAYIRGRGSRITPGGFKKVAVPIFKNKSKEVGIEAAFTNALRNELSRSHVAYIVDKANADAIAEGTIEAVAIAPSGAILANPTSNHLPTGTVLMSANRVSVTLNLRFYRVTDGATLWTGTFSGERTYQTPLVTLAGVNSVNPLYNLSARRQNIDSIALDMMEEAHDRLTENF